MIELSPVVLSWDEVRAACTELSDGAFMATVQPDSRPHLAWVGVGFGEEKLWTATYASSQKGRNLRHQRQVSLHWPEHPERLIFMRAGARLVEDRGEVRSCWDAHLLPYDQEQFYGSPNNPELLFVELRPTRVSISGPDPSRPPAVWAPAR